MRVDDDDGVERIGTRQGYVRRKKVYNRVARLVLRCTGIKCYKRRGTRECIIAEYPSWIQVDPID